MTPSIDSKRLILTSIGVPALELLLSRHLIRAATLLSCQISSDYPIEEMPLERRLAQIRNDPAEQPWLLRAIIDRDSQTMIGHIGFHTPPDPSYLAEFALNGVELGYGIHPLHRRKGFASEAALAMMRWAHTLHAQRCFVLSISPNNVPSTAMAKMLGFNQCGSHIDEEDGLEIIYARRFEQLPPDFLAREQAPSPR